MASRMPHCPKDHTYSHTQRITRLNCVILRLPRTARDRRWLDSGRCRLSSRSAFWTPIDEN